MDQREAVRGLFDRVAATYDTHGVDFFQPIAQRLVDELDPQPGERALDVGCGRGAVLLRLAQRVGPTGRACGIDLSPRMVEVMREEAGTLPVEVEVADGEQPPYPPQSFDVVAASLVIFFLPDPAAALRAWRTLLSPGGRVGVTTFGEHSANWKVVDEVFAPYLPPERRDPRASGKEELFQSDAGVEELLTDAGFAGVRTSHLTVLVRFTDADHWHEWSWSVGQRAMWEAVPELERDAVRQKAYAALEQTRDGEGRIGFDQGVRLTLGSVPAEPA